MTRAQEQRLIERAARGDRAAAERLLKAHQPSLYAYMLRLSGRPDVAEDIVQDAFVRVLTHLERFDPRYRFSTWLFTIAKRLYVNACQKHKPRYDSEIVDGWRGDEGGQAAQAAISGEVRANATDAITEAFGALTEPQREVVLLFHQQGWSIKLIADHLDIPEGTVKSHLHRGRLRLRRALNACDRKRAAIDEVWN
ncbi:MAG: RNA polymerase sigma factor [Planctomycetota bacterium]|nr:MAG: RNA polymerase sigma factor [Planctomycetota bacterium]